MRRSYYSGTIQEFLAADGGKILDEIRENDTFKPDRNQTDAWREQILILKDQLRDLGRGHVIFEYTIPRMGKRVDTVVIHSDFVFVMEFKVNKKRFERQDEDQCTDYALDLKNFHEDSHCASIVPILVSTEADSPDHETPEKYVDCVYHTIRANKDEIRDTMRRVSSSDEAGCRVTATKWEDSMYRPTPTITEAATALCGGISGIDDLMHSDAGKINLDVTAGAISGIIEKSKRNGSKSICFVTGVPGSGKTLAALNLVCGAHREKDGRAVLLSGNQTLVDVLKESLVRGGGCMTEYDGKAAASLIQHIPKFRNNISPDKPSLERIMVFDEAQRAWSAEKLAKSQKTKNLDYHGMSDPELLIGSMARHKGWAVIVCLIGEGQEIYDGEVGLSGWLEAIRNRYPKWNVYHSARIDDPRYGKDVPALLEGTRHDAVKGLHLDTSIRSFRAESLSMLVSRILDRDAEGAREVWRGISDRYPIAITRDINKAKKWVRGRARGTERYGIVASSEGYRLGPHGIFVKSDIKPVHWFMAGKDDIRSSYYMEKVATEFYIQGLELDWVCLAWDANLRYIDGDWQAHRFRGSSWGSIKTEKAREYLLNSYRVLLTRARQGMVIFVPEGDDHDATRNPEFYDGTYEYLKGIGFEEI